ncbi:serine hydrolase domain-containing protein [Candidatus Leptofilum sp.]|uniref:serine hydrolase domain-containing protein n=1 Tax=Candidatus Leptofilum sp. TaxID=3241576 RepID=UPI003B5A6AD4
MMKHKLFVWILLLTWITVACTQTESATETAVAPEPETIAETEPPPPEPTHTPLPEPSPTIRPTEEPAPADENVELEAALQAIVDKQVNELGFPSVVLLVDAPDLGLQWQGAAGMADPTNEINMVPEDQFALASVTKMVTAVAIVKLAEQGSVDIDAPIANYLPEELIAQLHVYEGESYGDQITVRQLLNQTTGFEGFSDSRDLDGNGVPDLKELVIAEPDTMWATEDVLAYALEEPPLFPPGAAWAYSDLNYQLLGLIIENASGMSLAEVYRQLIFEPLGMSQTYLEFREEPVGVADGRSLSHLYFGTEDLTNHQSRSYDWGAGGLVSTAGDQLKFMRALVEGDFISDPNLAAEIMNWVETGFPGWAYGFGIFNIALDSVDAPGLGNLQGHSGTWNNFAYYIPELNIVLVGTLNSSEPAFGHLGLVIEVLYTIQAMSG